MKLIYYIIEKSKILWLLTKYTGHNSGRRISVVYPLKPINHTVD